MPSPDYARTQNISLDLHKMHMHLLQLSADLAAQWFAAQCRNEHKRYFLFYEPGEGARAGRLAIAETAPSDRYRDAGLPAFSCADTAQQVQRKIRDKIQVLPILATEGEDLTTLGPPLAPTQG